MANTFYTFASAASTRMPIESGLDIIISHFEPPYFPRRISTHTTRGEQILVYSREETLARFRQSNLIDCRISTYPYPVPVSYEGVNMQPPNFFLSDIDRKDFKTNKSFNEAMQQTLQNFRDKLHGGSSSVLWSGGGLHFLQPLDADIVLEMVDIFAKFREPSRRLMQYAEMLVTDTIVYE